MDINEIYYAIQAVNSDPNLDSERKSVRLGIYQALLYYFDGKNKLNTLVGSILTDGEKLEKLSDYNFLLNEDLEKTRILVKGYIFESRFIKELKNQGIEKFSFNQLENYLQKYISSTRDTIDDVSLAVSLYPKIEEYKVVYEKMYEIVGKYLSEIFGEEMLKNSGDLHFKYECILQRIDRMSGRDLFDQQTRESLEYLIGDIFSYFVKKKIIIPIKTQIDVSGTKELIN